MKKLLLMLCIGTALAETPYKPRITIAGNNYVKATNGAYTNNILSVYVVCVDNYKYIVTSQSAISTTEGSQIPNNVVPSVSSNIIQPMSVNNIPQKCSN